MRSLCIAACLGLACSPSPQSASSGAEAELVADADEGPAPPKPTVGKLHLPLGTRVVLHGLVVEGPHKGWEDGPTLRVQRIDGRATDEVIEIRLAGKDPAGADWHALVDHQHAHIGESFEIEGHEEMRLVGLSERALKSGLQGTSRYWMSELVTERATKIPPVVLAPREFVGREALVEGTARTTAGRALLVGRDMTVVVNASAPWPADIEGRLVEVRGVVRESKGELAVDGPWHLARLEDQVGREVELRGRLWSLNGHWWFNFRGTDLYVDDVEHAPGFDLSLHGHPVVVRGRLERASLPRIDQIALKATPDRVEQFIVRKAQLTSIEALLAGEDPPR